MSASTRACRVLLAVVLATAAFGLQAAEAAVSAMSFNIRCGYCEAPDDPNHWSRRLPLVADLIARQAPDLVGLQEAELFQVRDLAERLPDYGWYGVGRDDGAGQGESNAVLYRKDRLLPERQRTLWLSPTPDRAGKGWDAAYPRTVTVIRFRDLRDGSVFYHFNTHFDHQGLEARRQSSRLIAALSVSETEGLPLVMTGDLNFAPDDASYRILSAALQDTAAGGTAIDTFNAFGKQAAASGRIDYIFVNGQFQVRSQTVHSERPEGRYASDHYAVSAVLELDQP